MKTHLIFTITLTVLATTLGACRSSEPIESTIVERASTPALTSIAAPTVVEEEQTIDLPKTSPELSPGETEAAIEQTKPAALETFEPEAEPLDGLTLVRFLTSSSIERREPTLASSSFGSDEERIYAFVEAKNESDVSKTLTVHFIGPDQEVSGGVELEIPASVPRWRTWAYTRHAKTPGLWRVEIRDDQGTLIGALPFEIEPTL